MLWYDRYLEMGGVDRSANPTPGNKKGGLSNIVEKAMGSIAKSGSAPIVEVLSPGERPTKKGLIFAATPASDIVCGPSQLASGIGLQVFMTGRGTPYGLAAAPVIKVCSRNEMKAHWFDLIDVNAGPIATGEKTIAEVGTELFHLILDVASGIRQPYSDQYGFHNDPVHLQPRAHHLNTERFVSHGDQSRGRGLTPAGRCGHSPHVPGGTGISPGAYRTRGNTLCGRA